MPLTDAQKKENESIWECHKGVKSYRMVYNEWTGEYDETPIILNNCDFSMTSIKTEKCNHCGKVMTYS